MPVWSSKPSSKPVSQGPVPLIYILLCSDGTSWVRELGGEIKRAIYEKRSISASHFSRLFPLEENTLVLEGVPGCQFGVVWQGSAKVPLTWGGSLGYFRGIPESAPNCLPRTLSRDRVRTEVLGPEWRRIVDFQF